MGRLARATVVFSAALTLLAIPACGSSGSGAAVDTTATTTAPTTTTTVPPSTTTTVPPQPQATPAAAAARLIDAWHAGDRVTGLAVASPTAVDVVFGIPPGTMQARGCNQSGVSPSYCVYRTSAGELQLKLTNDGPGWLVADAILGTG
jgi:hypothetical protein